MISELEAGRENSEEGNSKRDVSPTRGTVKEETPFGKSGWRRTARVLEHARERSAGPWAVAGTGPSEG